MLNPYKFYEIITSAIPKKVRMFNWRKPGTISTSEVAVC